MFLIPLEGFLFSQTCPTSEPKEWGKIAKIFQYCGFQLYHINTVPAGLVVLPMSVVMGEKIVTNRIFFLFKLRVVIPDVSILPEDLEELYDLFKVSLPEKKEMHLSEASGRNFQPSLCRAALDLASSPWAVLFRWDLVILSFCGCPVVKEK